MQLRSGKQRYGHIRCASRNSLWPFAGMTPGCTRQKQSLRILAASMVTPPLASLGAGVSATGILGFAAAAVFAVVIPRLRHRRNY